MPKEIHGADFVAQNDKLLLLGTLAFYMEMLGSNLGYSNFSVNAPGSRQVMTQVLEVQLPMLETQLQPGLV